MNSTTVGCIVLTRRQRDDIILSSLGRFRSTVWDLYRVKDQDMEDYVNDAVCYFYQYKDFKYSPVPGASLEDETKRYKNFFLNTTLQNVGKSGRFLWKYKTTPMESMEVLEQVTNFTRTQDTSVQTLNAFIRDYGHIDDIVDVEEFFGRLQMKIRYGFRYEIARKIRYYIRQWRKGNKVHWTRYFHGRYDSIRRIVAKKFKELCGEVSREMAFEAI